VKNNPTRFGGLQCVPIYVNDEVCPFIYQTLQTQMPMWWSARVVRLIFWLGSAYVFGTPNFCYS